MFPSTNGRLGGTWKLKSFVNPGKTLKFRKRRERRNLVSQERFSRMEGDRGCKREEEGKCERLREKVRKNLKDLYACRHERIRNKKSCRG